MWHGAGISDAVASDGGNATLEPATIAAKCWEIYSARRELSVKFS